MCASPIHSNNNQQFYMYAPFKRGILGGAVAVILFGIGCTPQYYAPNSVQTPYLEDQHSAHLRTGLVNGSGQSGFELQAAYSPLKHLHVVGNYFSVKVNPEDSEFSTPSSGNGRLLEGGIGGYLPLKQNQCLSMTLTYGNGMAYNQYADGGHSTLRFQRYAITPAYVVQNRIFRFGLGLRISRLDYYSGDIVKLGQTDELAVLNRIERKDHFWFPESTINMGIRVEPFLMSLNWNSLLFGEYDRYHFARRNFGVSISCDVDKLFR